MADRKAPEHDFPVGATIADLNRASAYAFATCPCGHEKPIFFSRLINQKSLGPDATIDRLRMALRCQRCRRAGADIRMPGNAPKVTLLKPANDAEPLLDVPKRRPHRDSPDAWIEWEKQRPTSVPGAKLPWHMAGALYRETCARDIDFALNAKREGRVWSPEAVAKAVAGLESNRETLSPDQAAILKAWQDQATG